MLALLLLSAFCLIGSPRARKGAFLHMERTDTLIRLLLLCSHLYSGLEQHSIYTREYSGVIW